MSAEAGVFEAFYGSSIQHPILLWISAALGLCIALLRPGIHPSLRRYCIALTLLSVLDAWLSTDQIFGLGALSGWLASAVPLFFVLAGDFRFLLLLASAAPEGKLDFTPRGVLFAAGITGIVPVFAQGVLAVLPEDQTSPRTLFLVYELAFASLTVALLRLHPGARAIPWLRSICGFVIFYYLLWAGADLVILLSGSDLGYLLRIAPNLLYYGGLIGAIAFFGGRSSVPALR